MTGWQLVPGGIGKILTQTNDQVAAVGTTIQQLADNSVEPLQNAAGFDGVVVKAFAGFLEEQSGRLTGIMNGYAAALEATAAATNAYIAGDEEAAAAMVAETQHAAQTGDMTRFQAGG